MWRVGQFAPFFGLRYTIKYDDLDIHVTEVKSGKEQGGLVIDVLVKFAVGDCKVVVHCYNTKQKVMVNGSGFVKFVEKY